MNQARTRTVAWLAALVASSGAAPAFAADNGHGAPEGGYHIWHDVLNFGNYEFWGAVFNFLLLLLVLTLLGRAPLIQYLKTRRLQVEEGLTEAKKMKEAAEAKHREYSDRLARLDRELDSLRAEMVRAGEAERDRIVAEAEAKSARMRKDAQFLIDQQIKQLRLDLARETAEAAVTAAEALLRAQATGPDQTRLATDYLERLSAASEEKRS